MSEPFLQLRDALRQLSLEADDQRSELLGYDITFELADDLENAVLSLDYYQETTGIRLSEDLVGDLRKLDTLFNDHDPGDSLWDAASLDDHPVWVGARLEARDLIVRIQKQIA